MEKPKHNIGDSVSFNLENEKITGTVRWVDENGTFDVPEEVCYDVLGLKDGIETIFKHIPESFLID